MITEPDVLCKSGSLLASDLNTGILLKSSIRWDTVCYLTIAESGYTAQPGLTVWPPLYPILIRIVSVFAHPPILAALIVSSLATWLAFILLYILVTENHDEDTAKNSLFLYAIYPLSFFLVSGYTESTFLLFVIASLLLAKRGNWIWSGILAGAAVLTRNQGILLSFVLLWEGYLQYKEKTKKRYQDIFKIIFASSLPMIAFAAFAVYVHSALGADWPWQTLGHIWGQYTGFPWEGIIGNIKHLFTLATSTDLYWLPTTIVDLILAVLVPVVLAIKFRSMRSTYMIYAWAMVLISLIKLGPGDILISTSRYMLATFPFFVVSSPVVNNRYMRLGLFIIGLMLQGALLYMFYIWSWAG